MNALEVSKGYFSALEVTGTKNLRVVVNPEYAELFPREMLHRALRCTLTAAAQEITHCSGFSFTHSPHHDFYLHILVNESGAVKIDGGGAEKMSMDRVREFLNSVAEDYR